MALKFHVIGYHYTGATKPLMKDLHKYVTPQCAAHWYDIGLSLDFDAPELDIIQVDNPMDAKVRCNKVFSEWLQRDLDASWQKIFEAFDSVIGTQSTGK